MSRSKRVKRTWKLKISAGEIARLADVHVGRFVSDGLELQASSAIWRTANGSATGRFVYRSAAGNSLVFTVRGLPMPSEAA